MKKIAVVAAIAAALFIADASAAKRVSGYVTKRGTYVAPHYQTAPNRTKLDNYSTKGNYNPYSGKTGTVDPYKPRKSKKSGW